MTLTYDSNLQSPASYGCELLTSKLRGQPSVGFEHRMETNGRTDGRTEAIGEGPRRVKIVTTPCRLYFSTILLPVRVFWRRFGLLWKFFDLLLAFYVTDDLDSPATLMTSVMSSKASIEPATIDLPHGGLVQ